MCIPSHSSLRSTWYVVERSDKNTSRSLALQRPNIIDNVTVRTERSVLERREVSSEAAARFLHGVVLDSHPAATIARSCVILNTKPAGIPTDHNTTRSSTRSTPQQVHESCIIKCPKRPSHAFIRRGRPGHGQLHHRRLTRRGFNITKIREHCCCCITYV